MHVSDAAWAALGKWFGTQTHLKEFRIKNLAGTTFTVGMLHSLLKRGQDKIAIVLQNFHPNTRNPCKQEAERYKEI